MTPVVAGALCAVTGIGHGQTRVPKLPQSWRSLPEVAGGLRRAMKLPAKVQAFGDPARGCYAAGIAARVDGAEASWQAIDDGLGEGLLAAGAKIDSKAAGEARTEREVKIGALRGRVHARYERTLDGDKAPGIDVQITACLYSARAPARCESECGDVLRFLEPR